MNVYLIGMEKELALTYTNMDLQGNLDKKFSVSWRLSPHHQRPKEKDAWPTTPDENLVRLQDAGEPVDRGIPKCSNCENLGHTKRNCPEEKQELTDRAEVKCFNCEAIGMTLSPLVNVKANCPQAIEFATVSRILSKNGHELTDSRPRASPRQIHLQKLPQAWPLCQGMSRTSFCGGC